MEARKALNILLAKVSLELEFPFEEEVALRVLVDRDIGAYPAITPEKLLGIYVWEKEVKSCGHCGDSLEEEAKFCPECGYTVRKKVVE